MFDRALDDELRSERLLETFAQVDEARMRKLNVFGELVVILSSLVVAE